MGTIARSLLVAGVALGLATSCGDDEAGPVTPAVGAPGELSLQAPGGHPLETARRRAPDLVIVRTPEGYSGLVRGEENAAIALIELERGEADKLLRIEAPAGGSCPPLRFTLPPGFHGRLLARVRYASGETWVRAVEL